MEQRTVIGSPARISEASFMSKVYLWMSLGLFVSAAASFWLLTQPQLLKAIFSNQILFIGIIVAEIAMVIWLTAAAAKMSSTLAAVLFCGYSFLNGVTLTSIFLIYTGGSILTTFAITAGTFFFFSLYGITTKKDLTTVGNLAMMGLVGVIIASIVNIFLKSSALMWISTFVGIAVFLGLIAYDTQKLKAMYANSIDSEEMRKKMAIIGALMLYLDFINLFILLLRIFGNKRN